MLKNGTEILGHVFGWLHRDKRRKLRRQKKKSLVHSKMTVHSSGLVRLNINDLDNVSALEQVSANKVLG